MGLLKKINKEIFYITIMMVYLVYIVYHILYGNYNLDVKSKYTKISELESEKFILENTVNKLKHNVNLLQVDSLDADIFDEEIKKNGFLKDNETIIYTNFK